MKTGERLTSHDAGGGIQVNVGGTAKGTPRGWTAGRRRLMKRRGCRNLLAVFGLAFAACTAPVYSIRVDPKVVHGDLAQSAVTTGDPSLPTRNVLFELGLFDQFEHGGLK